jgi:hypothetical protein
MPAKQKETTIEVEDFDLALKSEEERIQLALSAIAKHGFRPSGRPYLSLREAAKAYCISKTTLTARFNGRRVRVEAHEHERKLSPGCESALVKWIIEMGWRGIPMDSTMVAEHAAHISGQELGENWIRKFRQRHPELKAKWTTGLEKCRAQSLNLTAVTGFFKVLEEVIETYSIPQENIYNMDEKGIQLGIGRRVLALVDRDQHNVQQVEDGNRELVTVIEAVCADGTAIRPSVVFKGARRDLEWGRNNPCNARCACLMHEVTPS